MGKRCTFFCAGTTFLMIQLIQAVIRIPGKDVNVKMPDILAACELVVLPH